MEEIMIDQSLLPDPDEIRSYRRNGYYISKKIYSDEEIEAAIEGMEELYRRELNIPADGPFHYFKPEVDFDEGLRKTDYASFYNEALHYLVKKPILGEIAARLTDSGKIRLWHDQLLYKPSQKSDLESNVGWHTDRMYWKTCSSEQMLTAWIPFHDCNEINGTIMMIKGSNSWPDNTKDLDFFSHDLESLEKKFKTGGRAIEKVPMILKKGCVSFHNCLTIHGSGPNRGENPRRSIAVHLQDESNHYQKYYYEDGTLADHGNDYKVNKVKGIPDYTDPQVCPVLYASTDENSN
jgi:ectoine hydroxylase-related dioxygenase (phytanoyl-CoA dioxygenase family)